MGLKRALPGATFYSPFSAACKAVEVRLPEVLDVFIPRQSKLRSQNGNQRDVNKPMCVMFFDSRLMRSVYNRTQPAFGKRPQGIAP